MCEEYNENDSKLMTTEEEGTAKESFAERTKSVIFSLWSLIFIISSVLICFAAARNTITWHFQQFWNASGDFWQSLWDDVLYFLGEDPMIWWGYGMALLSNTVYCILGGIFTIIDLTQKPSFMKRFKIQPGTNENIEAKRLLKVIGVVFVNLFFINISFITVGCWIMQWRGYPPIRKLPTFHWVLFDLAAMTLIEEVAFYYSHR